MKSSPFKLVGEEAGENIIFDEFEEEITEDAKFLQSLKKLGI